MCKVEFKNNNIDMVRASNGARSIFFDNIKKFISDTFEAYKRYKELLGMPSIKDENNEPAVNKKGFIRTSSNKESIHVGNGRTAYAVPIATKSTLLGTITRFSNGELELNDKAVYLGDSSIFDNKTAKYMPNISAQNKALIERLQGDFQIRLHEGNGLLKDGEIRLGEYSYRNGVVTIDIYTSGKDLDRILTHELVHALTYAKLSNSSLFREKVQGYMALAGKFNTSLEDEMEFLADAYSNPTLQSILDDIPYRGSTLWSKLWAMLKSVFGFEDSLLKVIKNSIDRAYIDKRGMTDITLYATKERQAYNEQAIAYFLQESERVAIALQPDGITQDDHYLLDGTIKLLRNTSSGKKSFMNLMRDLSPDWSDDWIENKVKKYWGSDVTKIVEIAEDKFKGNAEQYRELKKGKARKSAIYGSIKHLLLELQYAKGKRLQEANAKLSVKLDEADAKRHYFNWFEKYVKKEVPKRIRLEDGDTVHSEVGIFNEQLGYAATADIVVQRKDGTLSVVDLVTAQDLDGDVYAPLFKYANTANREFVDNYRNRKKLQIFTEMVFMKLKQPELVFRDNMVLWIPSESAPLKNQALDMITMEEFKTMAFMVREMLKQENENEDSPLFNKLQGVNINFLNDVSWADTKKAQEVYKQNVMPPAEEYTKLMQELMILTHEFRTLGEFKAIASKYNEKAKRIREQQKRIDEIIKRLVELQSDDNNKIDIVSHTGDIDGLFSLFNNVFNTKDPIVEQFAVVYKGAKAAKEKEMAYIKLQANTLLEKALKKRGIILHGLTMEALYRQTSIEEIFKPYYFTQVNQEGIVTERMLTGKYEDEKAQWDALSEEDRAYLSFLDSYYERYVYGKNAFLDQKIVRHYDSFKQELVLVSHKELSFLNRSAKEKDFSAGFNAKFLMGEAEFLERNKIGLKDIFNKDGRKKWRTFLYNKWLEKFYEDAYTSENNGLEVIPVRGLGSERGELSHLYSKDLHTSFIKFMDNMTTKEQMDPVWSFGRGLTLFYTAHKTKDSQGTEPFKMVDFLEKEMEMLLLNQKQSIGQTWVGKKLRIGVHSVAKRRSDDPNEVTSDYTSNVIAVSKLLQYLAKNSGMALMFFNFSKGILNSLEVTLRVFREAMVRSESVTPIDTWLGITKIDYRFFNPTELAKSYRDYIELEKDYAMNGYEALKRSKAYLLAREMGYLTHELAEEATPDLLSSRSPLLKKAFKTVSMGTYTVGEQATAYAMLIAQLRSMKFKNEHGIETSVWDSYEAVDGKITWKGGKRFAIKSNNTEIPVYELTDREKAALVRQYEYVNGAYLSDTKMLIQYYWLGDFFIAFKKFLPQLITRSFSAKRTDGILGGYKVNEKGEAVWEGKEVQGRFNLLFRVIMGTFLRGMQRFGKFKDERNLRRATEVSFDEDGLSQEERVLLKEMIYSFAMYLGISVAIYLSGGSKGDYDDKDSFLLWAKSLRDQVFGNILPHKLFSAKTFSPVAPSIYAERMSAYGLLLMHGMMYFALGERETSIIEGEGILDSQNELLRIRGLRNALRYSNFGGVYNTIRFYEKDTDDFEFFGEQ